MTLGLGMYGLYEPHESHFAMVGREMVLRGDWITPYLNGAPYLNKPPLLYWLIAISTSILGNTEFAVRFPIAIAGWLGVVLVWRWSRDLWGINASRIAVLMMSVTFGWFIFTHQILIDVLLSTLLIASYYCLWKLVGNPRLSGYWFAFYGLLGLCILCKGPLMLLFPLLGLAGVALARGKKDGRMLLRELHLGWGLLLSLAIAAPWAIAIEQANPDFLSYFLFNENLQRIVDNRWPPDYTVSQVNAWGYAAISMVWCLPWSLLLLPVVGFVGREWQVEKRRSAIILLWVGFLLPVGIFLPLSSRLIYYSIPAIPPFIILCAGWFARGRGKGQKLGGIVFCLLGIATLGAALFPIAARFGVIELAGVIRGIALAMGGGCLVSGILLLQSRRFWALALVLVTMGLTYGQVRVGFALMQDFRSAKTAIEIADPCLGEEALWTFEGSRELGAAGAMSFYLGNISRSQDGVGWTQGKGNNYYRIAMVLTDGGANRLPPAFPGDKPEYAIARWDLQAYWDSSRPTVFMTDFLRQQDDPNDPSDRNLPVGAGEPLLAVKNRKLYGNPAARKLFESCHSSPFLQSVPVTHGEPNRAQQSRETEGNASIGN